jgi:hypothetical protein
LKKADIIKSDIFNAVQTFIEVNSISTKINSLWEQPFSKMCQDRIDKHALSKNYLFVLVSFDGIFLPYGVRGVFTSDIDNGVRNGMCINFIIICWSVHDTEMTMEEVFLPTISKSDFISRSWFINVFQ